MRETPKVRIAAWNLEGRWTPSHQVFLTELRADILLLTEVQETVTIPGMQIHFTTGEMQPGRRWAAVASTRHMHPLSDPHGATAMAEIAGMRVASSILPWRTCGSGDPWQGGDMATRTLATVDAIESAGPTIWGGDWNHELTGRLYAGCTAGRSRILQALDQLGLTAPTADSTHRLPGARSIDHIAVPAFWSIKAVEHHSAAMEDVELSDHDAYVAEVAWPLPGSRA